MRIADQIKNARIQKEYTQEQAAENLFVSRQTISNWENGKSLPDILSIIRMSELYELSLDELMKMLVQHRQALNEQIARLQEHKIKLDEKIEFYRNEIERVNNTNL